MKNAPVQTTNESAGDTANYTTGKFYGTDNPRDSDRRKLNMWLRRRKENLDAPRGEA